MTYRELLAELQSLSDDQLDKYATVLDLRTDSHLIVEAFGKHVHVETEKLVMVVHSKR